MAKKNFTSSLGNLIPTSAPAATTATETVTDKKGPGRPKKVLTEEELADPDVRATFIIRESILEKIKDHAYWERLKIKDVLEIALNEYFDGKKIKPRKK